MQGGPAGTDPAPDGGGAWARGGVGSEGHGTRDGISGSYTGYRFEEMPEGGEVCRGGSPMKGQESIGAVEHREGPDAGEQNRLKGKGEVTIRKGNRGMIAGMEIIGDQVEDLDGDTDEGHYDGDCGDGGDGVDGEKVAVA